MKSWKYMKKKSWNYEILEMYEMEEAEADSAPGLSSLSERF